MIYQFKRGSTIIIALDVVLGDAASAISITAQMCKLGRGETRIKAEDLANGIPMNVIPRVAGEMVPAGWDLTIIGSVTATLSAGLYLVDAKIISGSGTFITENSARVEILQGSI